MGKNVAIMTVLIMFLVFSSGYSQGLTVVVDKIKDVEKQIEQDNKVLNEKIVNLNSRLDKIKSSNNSGSQESITALQSQVNSFAEELLKLQNSAISSQTELQNTNAELYLQISQLQEEIAAMQSEMHSEPEVEEAIQEAPAIIEHHDSDEAEWEDSGLEISGFFDVVSSYDNGADDRTNYALNQAEIDLARELSENVAVEAAVAFNSEDGVFELGAALVDINLYGTEADIPQQTWQIRNLGVVVGQFDVPFGIDLNSYPSIERKLVSGPLAVDDTHGGWNDFGVQFYIEADYVNLVAYWVNGFESAFEVTDFLLSLALEVEVGDEINTTPSDAFGFRMGVSPIENLEIGTSFSVGTNDSSQTEMTLWGLDGRFEWNDMHFKSEYIVHHKNKSISEEEDKGFYIQGLYSFGKPFMTIRYGGVQYDGADSWDDRYSFGAGYMITEGVRVSSEYQINDADIDNVFNLQLAVGF